MKVALISIFIAVVLVYIYYLVVAIKTIVNHRKQLKEKKKENQSSAGKIINDQKYILYVSATNELIYQDANMIGVVFALSDAREEFPDMNFQSFDTNKETENICYKCLVINHKE